MSETKLQPSPVCPHCGHEHGDAWEWNFGPALDGTAEERECEKCEGVFDADRVVELSYTTRARSAK